MRWQLDYGLCVFCGRCVEACPENAIVATGAFELAARQREDVIAVHVVKGGRV
jgi:hydrogenase-4 component H